MFVYGEYEPEFRVLERLTSVSRSRSLALPFMWSTVLVVGGGYLVCLVKKIEKRGDVVGVCVCGGCRRYWVINPGLYEDYV